MPEIILLYPIGGNVSALTSKRLPIGLLAVSAKLAEEGYNIKIIDQQTDKNWRKTLHSCLVSNPICVGIGCTTGQQIISAIEASRIVKENSNVPVIWGGVHASILPEQTLENKNIDIVVRGEGDITFYELVKALEKEKDTSEIKGISYKQNNIIKHNPQRLLIENLDSLPDLPFELVDIKQYNSVNYTRGQSMDLMTSKGCPFGCAFCYNTQFNNSRWRGFSVERSLQYIKRVVDEYNVKDIHFVDDNMGGSQKHFMGIIKGIIKEGYDIAWGTNGLRVNNISNMDNNELKLLERSGCREMGIGVESANKRILELVDKKITLEQVNAVNRRMADLPIAIKYTFMIGFPSETKEEIDQTVKYALALAEENKNAWTGIFVYMPYPGTPLYPFAVQNGFDQPKNLEGWAKFNSFDSWHKYYGTWMQKKMVDYITSISFLSHLYNKNIRYKITNKFTRLLFDIYQPIAKTRLERGFYKFPIEMKINAFLEKMRMAD